jgi:hypothetical protein
LRLLNIGYSAGVFDEGPKVGCSRGVELPIGISTGRGQPWSEYPKSPHPLLLDDDLLLDLFFEFLYISLI